MATDTSQPKVALVIGAGDATGGAIARRFAREGYIACVTRRSADKLQPLIDSIRAEGGQAYGYGSDARKEEDVAALFAQIEAEHGPVEVMVFNIGANVPSSILEETARKISRSGRWRVSAVSSTARPPPVGWWRGAGARFCSPVPRRRCAARPILRPLPVPNTPCVHWPKAWRASWAR